MIRNQFVAPPSKMSVLQLKAEIERASRELDGLRIARDAIQDEICVRENGIAEKLKELIERGDE